VEELHDSELDGSKITVERSTQGMVDKGKQREIRRDGDGKGGVEGGLVLLPGATCSLILTK